MLFNSLVLIATLAGGVAIAEPIRRRSPLVVKESTNVPAAWSRVSKGPADHVIELRMALKQARFDELERQLYEGKHGPDSLTSSSCLICSSLRSWACEIWTTSQ